MNKTASTIVRWITKIVFGLMLGIRWVFFWDTLELYGIEQNFLLSYILFLLLVGVMLRLQSLVQVIGSVIGGLLTGYRVGHLQIWNLEILHANGRTRFRFKSGRQRSVLTTLFLPNHEGDRYPVVLRVLGGSILSLILGILLMILSASLYAHPVVSMLLYTLSIIGLMDAILSGTPITYADGTHNIGFMALELAQDDISRHANLLNTKMMEALATGIPLQDMPKEWFPLLSRTEMENSFHAVHAINTIDYLIFREQYDAAVQLAKELAQFGNLSPNQHSRLADKRLFLELVTQNRPEVLSEMLTQTLRNRMEQTKFQDVTTLIARYAYMMLYKHDAVTAKTVIEDFEKAVRGDLFPADVQGDRNLLLLVDRVAARRSACRPAF